jgi:ribosomal protection tetracycline resistance protein
VSWDRVQDYMHLESYFSKKEDQSTEEAAIARRATEAERWIDPDEIDAIIERTYYANRGRKSAWKKRKSARISYYRPDTPVRRHEEPKEEYLLVDGYNIIHAWPELNDLVDEHMDIARTKLQDILSNYQGIRRCKIILVFDAYRIPGDVERIIDHHNIHIVYTKEAQTADQYIEKFVHDYHKKYRILVATSDAVEQMIIRGKGADLMSARELREEIQSVTEAAIEAYRRKHGMQPNYLVDSLNRDTKDYMAELMDEDEG